MDQVLCDGEAFTGGPYGWLQDCSPGQQPIVLMKILQSTNFAGHTADIGISAGLLKI
jgi:hypothetical protein